MQQAKEQSSSPRDRLLRIYLQDHLAASRGVAELTSRCRGHNRSGPLGEFLQALEAELQEDRAVARKILGAFGGSEDPFKATGAWLAEKAGRLKLNGSLMSYSDLSRVEELETIGLGLAGKWALWAVLKDLAAGDSRLAAIDFAALEARVGRQSEQLENFRLEAARRAFRQNAGG